jgi:hypothetical protein
MTTTKRAAAPTNGGTTPDSAKPDTTTPEAETPPAAAAPAPAAAPLAPPAYANTAPAAPLVVPQTPIPANADEFLGYVTDNGEPLDPDDLFDMSGAGTIVVARVRSHALTRRGGSVTKLQTLAYPAGTEVNRAEAVKAIALGRAAAVAADS